jgi:hypothetical protein
MPVPGLLEAAIRQKEPDHIAVPRTRLPGELRNVATGYGAKPRPVVTQRLGATRRNGIGSPFTREKRPGKHSY